MAPIMYEIPDVPISSPIRFIFYLRLSLMKLLLFLPKNESTVSMQAIFSNKCFSLCFSFSSRFMVWW